MRLEDMREEFPEMPESMRQMIEQEVAAQVKRESRSENNGWKEPAEQKMQQQEKIVSYSRKKKKGMAHRMLIASMVAALALATTVCAGVVYQMHNQKVGKYGVKTQIERPQTVAESTEDRENGAAGYVRLETSYLPEGMVQSEEGKYSFEDHYAQGGISMIVYRLTPGEAISDIENTGIAMSEETEIGGRPAVYMEEASEEGNAASAKKLYVIYAEYNYLLEMFIFPDVSKEEAFQIAEGVSVTPTEETDGANVMQICDWNESGNEVEKGEEVIDSDIQTTFSKSEMKNMHAIGEEFSLEQNGNEATPGLTATISDVELSDNIRILPENMIEEDIKEAFDENGNLLPMEVKYIRSGDGIQAVDEVVETKEVPMKIVYVTVDYKNNGDTTLSDVMFNGGIAFLTERGNEMQFDSYTDEKPKAGDTWDYVNADSVGFSQEVYLMDVYGGERHNNYIDTLKPGETVTVHMAFKVPEEKLSEMYLTLSNYGGSYYYDETSLELGYVDIRQ